MDWIRKYETLKCTKDHMNYILVETWEYFRLSSSTITQEYIKKKNIIPLSQPEKGKNNHDFLADTQTSKAQKADETESIAKSIVALADM